MLSNLQTYLGHNSGSGTEKLAATYQYWRIRTLYSMFIGYALYYFCRLSYTFAKPGMAQDLGLEISELGFLSTLFALSYALSKFFSGMLSDRSNSRYFMAFGLLVTGVLNILFGLSSSLTVFSIIWCLNGWFQGFGWPPCARLLTQWYSKSERGRWWSIWSVSHNVGAFFIPWVVGYALYYYNWRFAMYLPGVICILGAVFLYNRLRDNPESLGLPPIEEYRNDVADAPKQSDGMSTIQIFMTYVLGNPSIWVLAVAYFFLYLARIGINEWTTLYLMQTKHYSAIVAPGTFSSFEVGGFIGVLVAGWGSDHFFGARRGPVNAIYSLGFCHDDVLILEVTASERFA